MLIHINYLFIELTLIKRIRWHLLKIYTFRRIQFNFIYERNIFKKNYVLHLLLRIFRSIHSVSYQHVKYLVEIDGFFLRIILHSLLISSLSLKILPCYVASEDSG